jgi:hypothetical protein
MIIGGFAVGVRILLEKGPSRHHISEDQEIPEKYQEIIFYQKTEEARRRRREEQQAGSLMTHKYRGCIVVVSINKSVEPNEEQKVLMSSFDQGITVNTSKQVFRGNWQYE